MEGWKIFLRTITQYLSNLRIVLKIQEYLVTLTIRDGQWKFSQQGVELWKLMASIERDVELYPDFSPEGVKGYLLLSSLVHTLFPDLTDPAQ